MLKLTWARAAAWRMGKHHLDRRAAPGSMLPVAKRLCGLHAQVMSSAELAVWARVEGLDREAVQRAVWEDRTLVKTWAMRGTLHLLPSSELPLWHAALGTSRRYLRPVAWKNNFGITMEQLDAITEAIATALRNRVLTREELSKEVARLTGSVELGKKLVQSSWGVMLKPAAFAGGLCFAPSVGQRVRFTHPNTWLASKAERLDPQTATKEVTRRFLAAYGPATHRDLARWWNGGGTVLGRQWMDSLRDELVPVEVEGSAAWMLAADIPDVRNIRPSRCVRLLPGFDQYVVGASCHAEQLMPGGVARSRVFRPQGWVSAVLLVNGRIQGTWRHEINGGRVKVSIEPFGSVPRWVRRDAQKEAERLAQFLGYGLSIAWRI